MSRNYKMLSLGEVFEITPAAGGTRPRGEPVRRDSRLAGREGVFWRAIPRKEAQRILYAAKRFDRINRPKGSRVGPLGNVALEVMELFVNLVDFRSGRLEPAIETIMRFCHRSRDAVVRALANLRQHGFLDWLRRYVPTDRAGPGPQVKQTSNAYRLSLPARAAALVGRWFGAPPPSDDAHRRETAAAEADAQQWAESPLGQAVERLGRLIAERSERESAQRTESPSQLESKR
jgi:hypothetical protein